jgi:hypothetical protein
MWIVLKRILHLFNDNRLLVYLVEIDNKKPTKSADFKN